MKILDELPGIFFFLSVKFQRYFRMHNMEYGAMTICSLFSIDR